VNKVVPVETLEAEALAAATRLAAKPRAALVAAKGLMRQAQRSTTREHIDREAVAFSALLQTPEAREAFAAFLEKRKPDFAKARANG
jgi:enoyl-CoA hydratase/carnithine racemase